MRLCLKTIWCPPLCPTLESALLDIIRLCHLIPTWIHMLFVCQGQVKKIINCSNDLLWWFQITAWHTPTCKLSFRAACRKPVNLCPFSFPLFPVKISISSHVAELEREDANEPESSFSTLSEPETTLQCYILWAMFSLFKGTCWLTRNWEGRASCRLEWSKDFILELNPGCSGGY